ncbi:speckle-type POZ protein-like [Schistocerca piceifrons]|uniref:speckle-type POZ protein-like n=1 Tax=Schistocerca piceifrons TaxID=274613 RepID=UPI001F5F8467|nr:speckle-type POZ protein-like [Schistocerca piceifrons]
MSRNLPSDLEGLLVSGEGADVTLVAGASQLPAHRTVLAARSPVFAAMLRHPTLEASSGRVHIPDVSEPVLGQLLAFVYTDEAPAMATMAHDLLAAADKYDVALLKKRCELQLASDLCVESAAKTAVLAVLHSCPLLRETAAAFIRSHPVQVMGTRGWEEALRNHPQILIEVCRHVASTTSANRSAREAQESSDRLPQLHEAAIRGSAEDVRRLLAAGAPVDARNAAGWTALHCAAALGHDLVVASLLRAGADVDARDRCGDTPLHKAAWMRRVSPACLLAAANAHLDAPGASGGTPLHCAAQLGHAEVVRALLQLGADPTATDHSGKTPFDLAKRYGRSEVVNILT